MATIKQLEKKTQRLARLARDIAAAMETARKALKAIEKAGHTFARPSWAKARSAAQADKLWLIHRQVQGERVREYIGTDPDRIASALQSVERGQQYQVLDKRLAQLRRVWDALEYDLDNLIDEYRDVTDQ